MAAILARRAGPGADAGEVICPSYAFSSSAGAFHLHGYTPVFVDVRADTLNLDERAVEAHVTPRTRVIVALHYAGVPCEMDALRAVATKHDLVLVEDAAQAIFSSYHGRPAGSLGDLAAFSFHGTKNLSCGEGGALTFRDATSAARAEILREKGTNRNQFVRGVVDKYTWVDLGGSYLPSDMLAAYLLAQLEGEARIHALRKERYERYLAGLQRVADAGGLELPTIPEGVESNYHLFHVLLDSSDVRDRLSDRLRAEGITATFHYAALHLTPMGQRFGPREGALPVSERAAATLLRLPLYPDLALSDVDRVIDAVERFFVPVARRQRKCAI
jgi:dTDP-4-amino-4,6-dideoxygalactose transaminase